MVQGERPRQEPTLLGVLGTLAPDLVPAVLAVDADRGWSLMQDAGPVTRTIAPADRLWDAWVRLLPRYAVAQLELTAWPPDDGGLTDEEAEALARRLPAYAAWCAELDAAGFPMSIQHDDLHSANICWPGGPEDAARARVIDWGDASVGHPFGTMLATLNSIAHHAQVELHDPRVRRVRDAYLEAFTGYGDHDTLVRLVEPARRTGPVSRALSYRAALAGEPVATHAELDFPVRGWFLEILQG